jgi:folate-dependent tRNA-U54 methylase TrmFO/GidA
MNSIFMIVSAILPFLLTELQQYKVVSPSLASLIEGIESAASAFASDITGKDGNLSITAAGLLAAISAAVSVLKTQTTISPVALSLITALDQAVAAGIAASNITSVDPTKLNPIAV